MKQQLNPAVAAVVILVVVGIAAFIGFKVLGKSSTGPGQKVTDSRYQAYQQGLKNGGGGGTPASGGTTPTSGGAPGQPKSPNAAYQDYQQKMQKK